MRTIRQGAACRAMPRAALFWPLLICASLIGMLTHATEGKAPYATQPDQGIALLLATVEQQIAAGHTTSPQDDNAMLTWTQVIQQTSPPSAAAVKALADFMVQARGRARLEKQAGRETIALDLVIFADLANDVLKQTPAAPAAEASRPRPASPQGSEQSSAQATPAAAAPAAVPRQPTAETNATPTDASSNPLSTDAVASASANAVRTAQTVVAIGQPVPAGARVAIAVPPAPRPEASRTPDASRVASYLERGDAMLARKDVSAARKYYAYGADAGSARAAAALAGTYDPAMLARVGVIGLQPNPALASKWYERAAALGDAGAADRLHALQAGAPRSGGD